MYIAWVLWLSARVLLEIERNSLPGSSCVSRVYKNLINDKSKYKKKNVIYLFVLTLTPHSYI